MPDFTAINYGLGPMKANMLSKVDSIKAEAMEVDSTIKKEGDADVDVSAPTPHSDNNGVEIPLTPSTTPAKTKKTATPKTPKTPKSATTKRVKAMDADDDASPTPKKKAKAGAARQAIPETFDALSVEDKMMLKWRADGKSWGEITKEWERLTGNKLGTSTLPNRFTRVQASIANVDQGDVDQMLASEKEVTAAIEAEYKEAMAKKWTRIATHMVENGAASYPASTIEKHYKKKMATTATAAEAYKLEPEMEVEEEEA